ncbi:ubiquitin thioesterase OTU1-like isoform X1 [Haliotis rufescens]|uniref:ubiquitin thioesterase OTU1-like isoform X1 n=2 Tax=Haliotis rufescens TaxID=6454 RepID=UPI001EB06FFD|nr:ubiquitin thioesterase OTU1-like isoform X1 [Haliotis rufescens]
MGSALCSRGNIVSSERGREKTRDVNNYSRSKYSDSESESETDCARSDLGNAQSTDKMANIGNKQIQLRCKTPTGQHYLTGVTLNTTVGRLKQMISDLANIPKDSIKIRQGYPPKVINTTDDSAEIETLPFRSGDTLIVEEEKGSQILKQQRVDRALQSQLLSGIKGMLIRKVVPANNSCLFTSVNTVMTDGVVDTTCAKVMRHLIADIVRGDTEYYNAGFLGKRNENYCRWILDDQSWGGGIELSILSRYYQVEIDVVDTQTGRIDRFGEDKNYLERVLLIYDGVHYDALILEPTDPSRPIETKFPTSDEMVLAQAMELAAEAKASRQFTDVANFSLRCLICQVGLTGTEEAQCHAKKTGHVNFGEY